MKKGTLLFVLILFLSQALPAQTIRNWGASNQNDRAFLGVTTEEISGRKATLLGVDNKYGAYIKTIVPGSAAEKAGLQPLDYLVALDDTQLAWSRDLTDVLARYRAGDNVTVHFFRKGKKQETNLQLGTRADRVNRPEIADQEPFLGITLHRAHSNYDPGVRVNIVRSTTADEMGLKDGDVILRINGYTMIDWTDITGVLNILRAGDAITIDYERVGTPNTSTGTLRSQADRQRTASNMGRRPRTSDYAFLGITSTELSQDKAQKLGFDNAYGSYVTGILGNTAAEAASLQPFDYVYGVDEYRTGRDQNLTDILQKYNTGETATLHYIRQGQLRKQSVTFTDRSLSVPDERPECENPFLGVQQSHASRPEEGVLVNVVDESTASSLGLQDGDIITHINGYPILDWTDLGTAVDATQVGEPITVDYLREGRSASGSAPILSECDRNNAYIIQGERSGIRIQTNGNRINLFGTQEQDTPSPSLALDDMDVRLEAMPETDRDAMRNKYDIEMPETNDLRINDVTLFPNPTMGMFRLEFELPQKGDTDLRIYNASGRQIYQYELGGFSGRFSDDVDIAQNGPGNYFLVIRQNGRAFAQKIVLVRN